MAHLDLEGINGSSPFLYLKLAHRARQTHAELMAAVDLKAALLVISHPLASKRKEERGTAP